MNKLLQISTVLLFIITFSACSFSQKNSESQKLFEIKTIEHNENYFPVFSCNEYPEAAEKVNQYLQLQVLQQLIPQAEKHAFERMNLGGSIKNFVYSMITNTEDLVSFSIEYEACGANCSKIYKYYNFNPKNGDRILLEDLILEDKYDAFAKMVQTKRVEAFKKELDRVGKEKGYDDNYKEDMNYVVKALNQDDVFDLFSITNAKSIEIEGSNQLDRMDSFDDYYMNVYIDYEDFKNYLNDYGKIVLDKKDGNLKEHHSKSFGQLYKGKMDKEIEILLTLSKTGARYVNAYGAYAYTKEGKGIYLEVEVKDGINFKMSETEDDGYSPVAFMHLKRSGSTLEGKWENKKKTKSFPVLLKKVTVE